MRRSRFSVVLAGLLVLGVVVVTFALGSWQLRRHDERRDLNALIEARLEEAPVDWSDIAAAGAADDGDDYRLIRVVGAYDTADEVVIRNRARNTLNGNLVATPLRPVDGGPALLVVRGWVPADLDTPPVGPAAPPVGEVAVVARLRRSEGQPGFGAQDPAADQPTDVRAFFNLDVDRIGDHLGRDLVPLWASLELQTPPTADGPLRPLDPVELTAGPHLNYAIQWFGIGTVALGSYLAWLWRGGRRDDEPGGEPGRNGQGQGPTTGTDASDDASPTEPVGS